MFMHEPATLCVCAPQRAAPLVVDFSFSLAWIFPSFDGTWCINITMFQHTRRVAFESLKSSRFVWCLICMLFGFISVPLMLLKLSFAVSLGFAFLKWFSFNLSDSIVSFCFPQVCVWCCCFASIVVVMWVCILGCVWGFRGSKKFNFVNHHWSVLWTILLRNVTQHSHPPTREFTLNQELV